MSKRTLLIAAAIVAVGCIAIPSGAYAANGGSWLLGRSNSESATTTVTNSQGTPLSLNAKTGYAPLKVNSSKTVTNLSADKLDGLSSGSFARTSGVTGVVVDDNQDMWGAVCPSGTIATGGGGYAYDDSVAYNGPDYYVDGAEMVFIPNSWVTIDTWGYVMPSFVICYSPTGAAIAGASESMTDPYYGVSGLSASPTEAPQHAPGTLKAKATK